MNIVKGDVDNCDYIMSPYDFNNGYAIVLEVYGSGYPGRLDYAFGVQYSCAVRPSIISLDISKFIVKTIVE